MLGGKTFQYGGLIIHYWLGKFCFEHEQQKYDRDFVRTSQLPEAENTAYIGRIVSDGRRVIEIPAWLKDSEVDQFVLDGTVIENDKSVRVIRLPDIRTWFRNYAFGVVFAVDCPNLEEVYLGRGTVILPDRLFYDCPRLRAIHLPESVRYIEPVRYLGETLWDQGDLHDPDVEEFFYEETLGARDDVMFYVKEGSYAHEYVKKNRFRFDFE